MPSRLDKIFNSPITLILIAFAAFVNMYFVAMKWGVIVMGDDWISYIAAAREFVSGRGLFIPDGLGYFKPLVHWPPGFPLVIALFSFLGIEPHESAKVLNSLLLAGNGLLIAYLLRTYGPKITWLPCVGMLWYLCSTTVLKIHANAMSEALFAFCTLSGFALLLKYWQTGSRVSLVASSFFIGWAFLTRYVGAAGVLVGLTVILIHEKHNLKRMISVITIFSLISCFPIGLFTIRNIILTAKSTSRALAWHPPDLRNLGILKTTFMNWLVPSSYPWVLREISVVVALGLLAVIFATWRPWQKIGCAKSDGARATNLLLSLCFLFFSLYFLLLLVSMSFFDRATDPDERIMFPVYFIGLIIIVIAAGEVWLNKKKHWYGKVIPIILCGFILTQTLRSGVWSYVAQRDGLGGYNAPVWQSSPTMAFLRKGNNTHTRKIITNDWGAVYFYTGKSALQLPGMIYTIDRDLPPDRNVGDKTLDFGAKWEEFLRRVDPHSMLIYFHEPIASTKGYFPSEDELGKRLNLVQIKRFSDGTVYIVPSDIN